MLTGLYPHNHGLTENDGRFGGRAALDGADRLLSHHFADAGYRCGWVGKWHLSQEKTATDFGFEGFSLPGYGYPYATPEYAEYLARNDLPDPVAIVELPGESRTPTGTKLNLKNQPDWFDYEAGTAILNAPQETHEAYFLVDQAVQWLDGLPADESFFLRVDPWGPHPPYLVPRECSEQTSSTPTQTSPNLTHDLSGRPQHHADYRDYWRGALVPGANDPELLSKRAFQQATLIEQALTDLYFQLAKSGKLDNTIVVFCADHGDAVGSNGGVLNKGGLMVEETMRIPLIISGPGIPAGVTCDEPVANIDIAPTLAQLCDLSAFAGDGHDLSPFWAGGAAPRKGLMAEHYGLHVNIIQRAWYEGDWKLVLQEDGFAELYNLATDPAEMRNLAGSAQFKDRLSSMHANLIACMDETNDDDPRLAAIRAFAT